MENNITFDKLGLSQETLNNIAKKGFKIPSEIQARTIPLVLENKNDIIGIAQTGTGKTAAFGLPIIEKIESKGKTPKVLILAPTRELAIQVCTELNTYKGNKRLNIFPVYGGQSITLQIREIQRGVDIVVGTPGRVLDLLNRRKLSFKDLEYFVLDEADEMLNMGFIDDIETILSSTKDDKRVLLFSATMPDRIKRLSKKYMKNQQIVETKKKEAHKLLIEQVFYEVKASQKFDALTRIIDISDFFYGIIFCRTKADVEKVTNSLKHENYDADCIHGDIKQLSREKILKKFKDQKINILVATDVAARGIDVENLTHVVNYSLPQEPETYVHRIGRTGRAGNKGTAITFISSKEYRKLTFIEKITKSKIKKEFLPKDADMQIKKDEMMTKNIDEIIEKSDYSKYLELTSKLIAKHSSEKVVSALLYKLLNKPERKTSSSSFGSSDRGNRESRGSRGNREDRFGSRDRRTERSGRFNREDRSFNKKFNNDSSNTRLFIAKGQKDKFGRRELIDFIETETRLKGIRGKDIKVCENFSFMTVPAREATMILRTFEKQNRRRPLVEIASQK